MSGQNGKSSLLLDLQQVNYCQYLIALFAGRGQGNDQLRLDLSRLALIAEDIRAIPFHITEPLLGEIRLQWWRDALDGIANDERCGNPLLDDFSGSVRKHPKIGTALKQLIDSYQSDLYRTAPKNLTELLQIFEQRGSAFLEAQLLLLEAPAENFGIWPLKQAAREIGWSDTLSRLAFYLSNGLQPLPIEELVQAKMEEKTLLAGKHTTALKPLMTALSSEIMSDLDVINKQLAVIPKPYRLIFAPWKLAPIAINKINRKKHNPLTQVIELSPLVQYFRLYLMS